MKHAWIDFSLRSVPFSQTLMVEIQLEHWTEIDCSHYTFRVDDREMHDFRRSSKDEGMLEGEIGSCLQIF